MSDLSIDFSRFCDRLKFHVSSDTILSDYLGNDYLWNSKFIRSKLCLAIGSYYQMEPDTVCDIAVVSELIHNASLIHDDIIDKDELRRSVPSVWKQHGKSNAILIGDLLIAKSFYIISNLKISDSSRVVAVKLLSETISSLVKGVFNEINEDYNNQLDVKNAYIEMISQKTGKLIQFSSECLLGSSKVDHATKSFISDALMNFACAYQISDDFNDQSLNNLSSDISNNRPNIFTLLKSENGDSQTEAIIALQNSFLNKANESLALIPGTLSSAILEVLSPYVSFNKEGSSMKFGQLLIK